MKEGTASLAVCDEASLGTLANAGLISRALVLYRTTEEGSSLERSACPWLGSKGRGWLFVSMGATAEQLASFYCLSQLSNCARSTQAARPSYNAGRCAASPGHRRSAAAARSRRAASSRGRSPGPPDPCSRSWRPAPRRPCCLARWLPRRCCCPRPRPRPPS